MAEVLVGVETTVIKSIKVGTTLTLILSNIYPFVYDYGKGREVLRLEVVGDANVFTEIYKLKGNTETIHYLEDDVEKIIYEGYYQDFACNYKDGVYSVELTRINSTDLAVRQLDAQVNPTIDFETCTLDALKSWQIEQSKKNMESCLLTNPITSSVHNGVEKQYSITKDKQSLLTQMILVTQLALQNGIEYQPSWNAVGEPCTYDWTLPELQQLAFEIETVVRPLVSHQQTMEAEINIADTKEAVLDIGIEF